MMNGAYSTMTVDGWTVNSSEFTNNATRQYCGEDVEVSFEECSLTHAHTVDVSIRGGWGYETYSAAASIPMNVLVLILERAGYTVSRPPQETLSGG
jgi:hypothetical protein